MKKIVFAFVLLCWTQVCLSQKITVKAHSVVGYGKHQDFAKKAFVALEQVLNSDEFKDSIIAMESEKNQGYTSEQLYNIIMQAKEKKVPKDSAATDGIVDLWVRTLEVNGRDAKWKDNCEKPSIFGNQTLGIDGAGDGFMAICPSALDYWASIDDVAALAGHYGHEYMHVLGFDHHRLFSSQRWREQTFVYKVGYLVRDLVKKMSAGR
ncbi:MULTISPECIES: hypothetical protein [Sphingobacterium]|uniref:Uncharacterized protein n=1 Tax=Sphingobacterium siyangense TaxID=459529 RepID=A0A562MG70_9SPHI|nr:MULTISPECIES: hypothetical protein [Sphingobacterium]TWI18913.1 hypothetical protein IQ31_03041 [Sphingobacterium siyangense]